VFDVTDSADHQKAHDYFEAGAGRLDILINNAGVHLEGECELLCADRANPQGLASSPSIASQP